MKYCSAFFAASMLTASLAYGETTTIKYSGRSGIAPVASATIMLSVSGSSYNTSFDGKGIGIAAVTQYKIRAKAKGVTGNSTKPSWAQMWTSRKGKPRDTIMTFGGQRPTIKITPNWTPHSSKEKLNLSHINDSIDIMSVMVRLSNQIRLKGNCWGTFNVTDGRSALQVTARAKGQASVSTNAYKGKATLCQLSVKSLSGRILRDAKAGSTQVANVYFAKPRNKQYPIPVRVTGKFMGFGVSLNADSIK
ncbi:MAG: DUF3108 domain-containing protein [Alphaproteobacteria bacterium]